LIIFAADAAMLHVCCRLLMAFAAAAFAMIFAAAAFFAFFSLFAFRLSFSSRVAASPRPRH